MFVQSVWLSTRHRLCSLLWSAFCQCNMVLHCPSGTTTHRKSLDKVRQSERTLFFLQQRQDLSYASVVDIWRHRKNYIVARDQAGLFCVCLTSQLCLPGNRAHAVCRSLFICRCTGLISMSVKAVDVWSTPSVLLPSCSLIVLSGIFVQYCFSLVCAGGCPGLEQPGCPAGLRGHLA